VIEKEIVVNNNKRELIETLVALVEEDELRSIVDNVIEAQRAKLNKLRELSSRLSGKPHAVEDGGLTDDDYPENLEFGTASSAVLKILREAKKSMSNGDIRKRYLELFGKPITPSAVGNALWKGKKKKQFKKVGATGSTRYTKWKYVRQDEQ